MGFSSRSGPRLRVDEVASLISTVSGSGVLLSGAGAGGCTVDTGLAVLCHEGRRNPVVTVSSSPSTGGLDHVPGAVHYPRTLSSARPSLPPQHQACGQRQALSWLVLTACVARCVDDRETDRSASQVVTSSHAVHVLPCVRVLDHHHSHDHQHNVDQTHLNEQFRKDLDEGSSVIIGDQVPVPGSVTQRDDPPLARGPLGDPL
jgi:hypothetical protein